MNWDDDLPKPKRAIEIGENLERLGVAELEERIAALQAEIARVEVELAAKRRHSAAAAALFKD